jgi:hypothetical protein
LENTWNAFPTELAVEQSHHRAINFVLLWCFSFFEEIKAVNVYAISYQKTTRGSFGTFQIGLLAYFNVLYNALPTYLIKRLQRVQNAAANI